MVVGYRLRQALRASLAVASFDDALDCSVVVELQALGLCERTLEVAGRGVGGDVEERAVDRRDRDSVVARGVLGIEGACAVQADPRGAATGRGRGHVRLGRVVVEEVPVDRGAEVAQHRAGPARHDRRQQPPLARQHRATDGVHAAMHPAQPPALQPPRHPRAPDAQRVQLRGGHHSPLPDRQLRDRHVGGCGL
jgi:hypothetical protein